MVDTTLQAAAVLIFYPINLPDSIHWIFVMVDMVHHSITAFDSNLKDPSSVGTSAHNAATLVREGLQAQADLHAELQIDVRARFCRILISIRSSAVGSTEY